MATEYRLSFTGSEINERLGRVDKLSTDVESIKSSGVQQTPLFANNLSECTATDKLYVLPDGYLYAYTTGTVAGGTEEVMVDVTEGFVDNTRLSVSSGNPSSLTDFVTTPFIDMSKYPIDAEIRLSGISWAANANNTTGYSVVVYDENKAMVTPLYLYLGEHGDSTTNMKYVANSATDVVFTVRDTNAERNFKYVRFCGNGTAANAVVQIVYTEEASSQTVTTWVNTGHAFVPADYEDRIVYLEKIHGITPKHKNQILSSIESNGTPYNGGVGYKEGYRLNSSGVETALSTGVVSGFIPFNGQSIELRIPNTIPQDGYAYLHVYDSNFTTIRKTASGETIDGSHHLLYLWVEKYGATVEVENGTQKFSIPAESLTIEGAKYIRISASADTEVNSSTFDLALGESLTDAETESSVGTETDSSIPSYWTSELEAKAATIRKAMETAGRNKSAFLWYTDAHWLTNSKKSPELLKYLIKNTPINKVNFGGDIINDPSSFTHENIAYAYEWRKLIADLSNHHSVYGNHDVNHRTTDVSKMAYTYMLAPEETSNMVVGGDSYYYIDNPSEKTRYLYLSYLTNSHTDMVAQGEFIVEALKSVPQGWHIVAIAHRWWQYTSTSNPMAGSVPTYEAEILSLFDAYNARTTRSGSNYFYAQDFSTAKGKVEFCIGGHIHVDYDFTTTGGIPIIITAADTNQERSSSDTEDSGTLGTVTESAVFGIVADYDNSQITVVGVGRGTSRVVELNSANRNLFDKNDADVHLTGRFNSSHQTVNYADGQLITGYIEAKKGDTFTVVSDKSCKTNGYTGDAHVYDGNKAYLREINNQSTYWTWSADNMTSTLTIEPTFWDTDMSGTAWIRFCVAYNDIDSIVITKS